MTSSRYAVFSNPVRTAIGTFGGSLKEVAAPDLGAAVTKAAVQAAGLSILSCTLRWTAVPSMKLGPIPERLSAGF
jgi:acetyl-CoA acetyltransferase